ncbi:lamin tail domain-containing protein, partial [Candidatus Microgenomates bacterium]|nr:lamin tail domain-containing protein [Candidatus Microgenomates bacterium]
MPAYRKFLFFLFITVVIFLFFPQLIFAQIVINEVLPNPIGSDKENEWIELYNLGSSEVTIIGYVLEDKNAKRFTISTDNTGGNETIDNWLVIYPKGNGGFALTNSGSEIKLFENSESTFSINTFSYSDSEEGKSWMRIPDGTGEIHSEMADSSPGEANSISTPTPTPTLTPTPSLIPTPVPTNTLAPTNTPSPSKATYKINEVKDEEGDELTNAKVYVDGVYVHHYAPETLTFCDNCKCDTYVDCGFGEHAIKLEKSDYQDWTETKTISAGDSHEANPVMNKSSSTSSPTSTPTKTPTPTKKLTSNPTPTKPVSQLSKKSATLSGEILGEKAT